MTTAVIRSVGAVGSLALFVGAACGDDTSSGVITTGAGGSSTSASTHDSTSSATTAGVTTGSGGSGGGANTSAGCLSGQGLAEGEHTFQLDGLDRRYIVRLSSGYSQEKAWPLVLALHPNGSNIGYWDVTSGPRNIRAAVGDDAVLVIPEAIGGNWRDYGEPADTWPARLERELVYFDEVLSQVKGELCIDQDGIFSMGFSGGGSFSGVLGCRRDDIRAIAVGGSVIYFDEADCVGTPAAWITIGQLELNAGREAFRDFFRDRAGCTATTMATDPPPCVAYDDCATPTPVHYCEHPGDHVWPDFGTAASWAFFSGLTG